MAKAQTQEIDFTQASQPVGAGTAPIPAQEMVPTPAAALPAPVQPATMLDIIERASRDPSVDIDKLERLIAMKDRMEERQARAEFDRAMQAAQEEMRAIRADMENPQTRSQYASYAQLDKAIRPIYTRHGFAVSLNTGDPPQPDMVRVLATVSHTGGHRQDYKIDMPADGKGARGNDVMTRTHATGAAASYGQRYLLKLIFNLAVGDVDDDGNGAGGLDADIEANAPKDALRDANGKLLSTYDATKAQRAKEETDRAIEALNLSPNKQAAREWWREASTPAKGKRKAFLDWLKDASPGQFQRLQTAYENVVGLE